MEFGGLFGILIACICAYASYVIAQSKNRSAILWGILGFIFPLIGLIVIYLLPPVEK
jgi:hypothetical protein